jgi:hypothetical protein
MKKLEIEDIKVGDKFICTKTQLDVVLDETIVNGKVYEILEIDEENDEVQLSTGEYVCWSTINEYLEPIDRV